LEAAIASHIFIASIIEEFSRAFQPLLDALSGADGLASLLARLGWSLGSLESYNKIVAIFDNLKEGLNSLHEAADSVESLLAGKASDDQIARAAQDLINAVGDVHNSLRLTRCSKQILRACQPRLARTRHRPDSRTAPFHSTGRPRWMGLAGLGSVGGAGTNAAVAHESGAHAPPHLTPSSPRSKRCRSASNLSESGMIPTAFARTPSSETMA
jgi:hypothetical protein